MHAEPAFKHELSDRTRRRNSLPDVKANAAERAKKMNMDRARRIPIRGIQVSISELANMAGCTAVCMHRRLKTHSPEAAVAMGPGGQRWTERRREEQAERIRRKNSNSDFVQRRTERHQKLAQPVSTTRRRTSGR